MVDVLEKKYQKILWIFNYPNPNDIPSYVVGGIMPANILGIKKIIFLENHDPVKFLSNAKPKAIIISKAFNKNIHNFNNFISIFFVIYLYIRGDIVRKYIIITN